jgi:hypothetical protein
VELPICFCPAPVEFGCVGLAFALLRCIPVVFAILDVVLACCSDSLISLEVIVLWPFLPVCVGSDGSAAVSDDMISLRVVDSRWRRYDPADSQQRSV